MWESDEQQEFKQFNCFLKLKTRITAIKRKQLTKRYSVRDKKKLIKNFAIKLKKQCQHLPTSYL